MKKLALTIPGLTGGITPPVQIQPIIQKAGGYGGHLFGLAIGLLFLLAAIIALGAIVWGGFKIISSQGDPKQFSAGRETIIYATIGLGVVFFSYLIIVVLSQFFGANLLGPS